MTEILNRIQHELTALLSCLVTLAMICFCLVSIVITPRRAWFLTGRLLNRLFRYFLRLLIRGLQQLIKLLGKLCRYILKGIIWVIMHLRVRKTLY